MDPVLIFLLAFAIGTIGSVFLTKIVEIRILPPVSSAMRAADAAVVVPTRMDDVVATGLPGMSDPMTTGAALERSIPTMAMVLGAFLLAVFCLLLLRTMYVLSSIRKIRRSKSPKSTCSPSFFGGRSDPPRPLKTLVVLGSGGHTTEMLHLVRHLSVDRYCPVVLVVAATDTTSLRRVAAHPSPLPSTVLRAATTTTTTGDGGQLVYRIPRSREVGQSYWSSVGTTIYSFCFALWLVGVRVRPDLVLVNGPGTCLPIAVSAFLFRVVGWKASKIVFVESFCRVTR